MNDTKCIQQAIVAGGCFWCIESPMQRLNGVDSAISGYMGGKIKDPSYHQICSGTTGHAEVVVITFDANLISYQQILQVFFALHDPTMLNQQGNDRGTQYRSAIFYQDEQQLHIAQQEIKKLTNSAQYSSAIVTTLEPEQEFYIADEDHQNFYNKNPYQPYCQIMIAPKLAKLESLFRDKVKAV